MATPNISIEEKMKKQYISALDTIAYGLIPLLKKRKIVKLKYDKVESEIRVIRLDISYLNAAKKNISDETRAKKLQAIIDQTTRKLDRRNQKLKKIIEEETSIDNECKFFYDYGDSLHFYSDNAEHPITIDINELTNKQLIAYAFVQEAIICSDGSEETDPQRKEIIERVNKSFDDFIDWLSA